LFQQTSSTASTVSPSDDGIVEHQLHELLLFLISWMNREHPDLLKYSLSLKNAEKFDQDVMLTHLEILLSEMNLRGIEAFEKWLASYASLRFERPVNFDVNEKSARLLSAIRQLETKGILQFQIRSFRSSLKSDSSLHQSMQRAVSKHCCVKCGASASSTVCLCFLFLSVRCAGVFRASG
jgi:hypothetical protein